MLWSAAGGFGDPLERDAERVKADVDNGDVTEKAALEIYGVVLGDARATERRRTEPGRGASPGMPCGSRR